MIKNKNLKGFSVVELVLFVAIIGLLIFVGSYVFNSKKKTEAMLDNSAKISAAQPKLTHPKTAAEVNATPQTETKTQPQTSTPPATHKTPVSIPAATPVTVTNTTNCLPPNPSQYATYYIGMTNSQYLQTNVYINTSKLYSALQFAGLINTINTKQYVVLAMDDTAWSNFTQSQLDWMNASPNNMRSVLGWQIITSCITWNGVNPVEDMAVGTTRTVNTLNGPVTYTAGTPGAFGNGTIGIWDWFTSNGSVTIAGFVDTSSVH